jgi:putative lipoprotein
VNRISPHLPVLLGCLLAAVALLPGACRTAPPAGPAPGDPSPWEAAAARGIDFRATGNEPGWFLELDDGVQIVLVTDYGRRRYEMPAPEPQVDEAARRVTFHTASTLAGGRGNRLVLTLAPGPCEDTMSGETFDTTVTVTIDGQTLHGCGRALS